MPIDIRTLSVAETQRKASAKPSFFHPDLTGTGTGSRGLLDSSLTAVTASGADFGWEASRHGTKPLNRDNGRRILPVGVASRAAMTFLSASGHDPDLPLHVGAHNADTALVDEATGLYVHVEPQAVAIDYRRVGQGSIDKTVTVQWLMGVGLAGDDLKTAIGNRDEEPVWTHTADADHENHTYVPRLYRGDRMDVDWSCDPSRDLVAMASKAAADQWPQGMPDDVAARIRDWLSTMSVGQALAATAQRWTQGEAAGILTHFLESLTAHSVTATGHEPAMTPDVPGRTSPMASLRAGIDEWSRHAGTYREPLASYRGLYAALDDAYATDDASRERLVHATGRNINLMLSHALHTLDERNKRHLLAAVPPATPDSDALDACEGLDANQRRAARSDSSLTLVQSVAGSGKSTTLTGRARELIARGVDPGDILVVSFTNAAVDHMREVCPEGVRIDTISSIIAAGNGRMHPRQAVNPSGESICSAIRAVYRASTGDRGVGDTAMSLSAIALDMEHDASCRTYTRLNALVAAKRDLVNEVLDRVGMTSLEIQIVMAYNEADSFDLVDPAECAHQPRFVLMDEVQDCSLFEFVFMLGWAAAHDASLFMVGDASQTLYEFRGADPMALNALEESGTFATFGLSTNYRSDPEVCEVANLVLDDLESNRFARLRLKSNDLKPCTFTSLMGHVHVDYTRGLSDAKLGRSATEESGPLWTMLDANRDWIEQRLDRDGQTAFLVRTRREVAGVEAWLAARFGREATNMTAVRARAMTFMTKLAAYHAQEVRDGFAAHPADMPRILTDAVVRAAGQARDPSAAMEAAVAWGKATIADMRDVAGKVAAGTMSPAQATAAWADSLFAAETACNRRSLVAATGRNTRKRENAATPDIVVSTIHGVKGLEFDNTVVIADVSDTCGQDDRRALYVALTRAKSDELLCLFGSGAAERMPFTVAWRGMAERLAVAQAMDALRASGVDPDTLGPDERRKFAEDWIRAAGVSDGK